MSDKHLFVKNGNVFGHIVDDDIMKMINEVNDKFRQRYIDLHKMLVSGKISSEEFKKELHKLNTEIGTYILYKYTQIAKYMRDNDLTVGFEIDFDEIQPFSTISIDNNTNDTYDIGIDNMGLIENRRKRKKSCKR